MEMCPHYTTTGHPRFRPVCEKGFRASLRCHSKRLDCPEYPKEKDEKQDS